MHILLVLVVCLAFFPDVGTAEVDQPARRALLTWLMVISISGSGALLAQLAAWQLRRRPEQAEQTARWFNCARSLYLAATLAAFLAILFIIRWGAVVRQSWGLENAVLIDELLNLAPFVIMLIAGWFSFYSADRAMHDVSTVGFDLPYWGRRDYILYRVRHYLGQVLAPILLFTGIHELVLSQVPGLNETTYGGIVWLACMMMGILLIMPWLLTVIWGAKPLPAGPLRDRLTLAAQRLGFRYTDILLWNTQRGVANAMVTGVLPVPRYVLLSDTLVQDLPPEEVEAVFGHEMGHVKHRHMLLYLGFLVLSLVLISTFVMRAGDLTGTELVTAELASFGAWPSMAGIPDRWLSVHLVALMFVGGYIWLVFGFLSRRCERQADVYGCKAISCTAPECIEHSGTAAAGVQGQALCPTGVRTFIRALERVADLNGIQRDKPSWRHSSIARRVEFLHRLLADPTIEHRFQRRLALVKWGLLLSLITLIVVAQQM